MGNSQENKQERQDHIKEFTIIVNAEPKVVAGKEISFEALVALAFPSAPKEQYPFYKITYHKAEGNKRRHVETRANCET